MKKWKKIIAGVLTATLAFSMMVVSPSAEEKETWEYQVIDEGLGTIAITGYNGNDKDVVIPEEIDEMTVTGIGSYVFYRCSRLASIEIPEGVTSIGYEVFRDCSGLKSVKIPDGVTSIDGYVFSGCISLESVYIADEVGGIIDSAFDNCTSLTNFIVSEGNENYKSVDGVLYSIKYGNIVADPTGKHSGNATPGNATPAAKAIPRRSRRIPTISLR